MGKQVSTEPLTAAEARAVAGAAEADVLGLEGPQRVAQQPQLPPEPAWKRVRQRALNPAHNPVMARNIRVKAQLAQQAARVAAKKAATTNTRYQMCACGGQLAEVLVLRGYRHRTQCCTVFVENAVEDATNRGWGRHYCPAATACCDTQRHWTRRRALSPSCGWSAAPRSCAWGTYEHAGV